MALPCKFDIIIVGTGLVESIIAAAASRIGKEVLHIDSDEYYGGKFASFSLDSIKNVTSKKSLKSTEENVEVEKNEKIIKFGNDDFDIIDVVEEWSAKSNAERAQDVTQQEEKIQTEEIIDPNTKKKEVIEIKYVDPEWTKEELLKVSRKFNIDLSPRLHFSRGDFVELLISSNIAKYAEFRSVSRVLTWLDNKLETVPCSRSDVFSSDRVSVIEKRMLMKLLTTCIDGDISKFTDKENKTFKTFLKEQKLTPNLIHFVLYSIAMSNEDTTLIKGMENTKRYLESLGRFGKTPFLFSMYGSGELPQAFCRLSAVFGGIYALDQKLNGIITDENKEFKAIICNSQKISANYLVMGIDKAPEQFVKNLKKSYISRAVFITDRSILESEREHLTLLTFPPERDKNVCTVIEMGSLSGTCPQTLYLVHMITTKINGPKDDFQHCIEKLFCSDKENSEDKRPRILWSFYFSLPNANENFNARISEKIYVCPGPDMDLDYDASIKEAKNIFSEIFPNEEFLPRAPDPEEIIFGDDDTGEENVIDGRNKTEA